MRQQLLCKPAPDTHSRLTSRRPFGCSRDFADSKTLTAEKRDQLFANIMADSQMGAVAEILTAQMICAAMLSREKVSLNAIASDSTFKLIQHVLDLGVPLTKVFIDTVGDAGRYSERLSRAFPTLQFTVCPKARAACPPRKHGCWPRPAPCAAYAADTVRASVALLSLLLPALDLPG